MKVVVTDALELRVVAITVSGARDVGLAVVALERSWTYRKSAVVAGPVLVALATLVCTFTVALSVALIRARLVGAVVTDPAFRAGTLGAADAARSVSRAHETRLQLDRGRKPAATSVFLLRLLVFCDLHFVIAENLYRQRKRRRRRRARARLEFAVLAPKAELA